MIVVGIVVVAEQCILYTVFFFLLWRHTYMLHAGCILVERKDC